jgi:hypothetical protein
MSNTSGPAYFFSVLVLLSLLFAYLLWRNSGLIETMWVVLYFSAFVVIGFLVSAWSVFTIVAIFEKFKGRNYNPCSVLVCSFIGLVIEVLVFRMLISYDIFTSGLVLALSIQTVASVITIGAQCWCYRRS